jgi:hypothetical protein
MENGVRRRRPDEVPLSSIQDLSLSQNTGIYNRRMATVKLRGARPVG